MATHQFSALSDGQAISFSPSADVLEFDQTALAAADIHPILEGSNVRIAVVTGGQAGKDVLLLDVSPFQLTTSNITFADGSRLVVGDNATASNDNAANTLTGASGHDLLLGYGGNDLFVPGGGSDFIDGGAGLDSIEFKATASSPVFVDYAAGTISGGGPGTKSFTSVERVVAGNFDDVLNGNDAAQNLAGQAGADTLWGAGGVDTLWGGSGADSFIFRETGVGNADSVNDFASGADKLVLDGSVMTALGAEGDFDAGDARFWAAPGASGGHDADDRVIYNTTMRQVFYDADGSGSGATVLLATLKSGGTLVASDVAVAGSPPPSSQVINGTTSNDSLVGGAGRDTLNGFGGNDTLDGLGDNDLLVGGDGDDVLRDVNNEFEDAQGSDTLNGGLGNDTYDLRADPFQDHDPVLVDAGGIDTVLSNHDFVLPGGFENLTVYEGVAGTGNSIDNVIATRTNEPNQYFVDGADGDDTLLGGDASDTFHFAAGSGNYGNDSVDGGGDFDLLSFSGGRSAVVVDMRAGTANGGGLAGSGSVTFTNIETVEGTAFNDLFLTGSTGGADVIDGGAGSDSIEFKARATSPVVVDYGTGTILGGSAGTIGFTSIERIVTGNFDDSLTGDAAGQNLAGQAGADTLAGAGGTDTLWGGGGDDVFIFREMGTANADRIPDWVSGSDELHLDDAAFAAIGAAGSFASGDGRFWAAAGATSGHDASDRVVFNASTGALYYDADGSGAGGAQLIATVQIGAMVAATDIVVI